jgi:hypothetical protein
MTLQIAQEVPEDFDTLFEPVRMTSVVESDSIIDKFQQVLTEIEEKPPEIISISSSQQETSPSVRVPTPRTREKEEQAKTRQIHLEELRIKREEEKHLKEQKKLERIEKQQQEQETQRIKELEEQVRIEEEDRIWNAVQCMMREEELMKEYMAEEKFRNTMMQLEEERKRKEEIERLQKIEEEKKRQEEERRRLEQERKRIEEEQRKRDEEARIRKEQELRRKEEERIRKEEEKRKREEEERKKRDEILRIKNEEERKQQERERLKRLEQERIKKEREEAERKKREEQELLLRERQIFEEQTAKFFTRKTSPDKETKVILQRETKLHKYEQVTKTTSDPLLTMLKEWQDREARRTRPRSRSGISRTKQVVNPTSNNTRVLDKDTVEMLLINQEGTRLSLISDGITKIAPDALSVCPQLRLLVLDANQIQDISGVTGLRNLKYLSTNVNKIKNVEGIQECDELIEFNASNNHINSLEPFLSCKKLALLDLSNNAISSLDIFRNNTTLLRLNLHGNSLIDLTGVDLMENICALNVGFNKIQRIGSLDNNPLIDDLVMYRNSLVEFPDFSSVLIRNLYLENNLLEHFNNRFFAPLLEILKINDNNIQSISALSSCINLKLLAISTNNISELTDLLALRPCRMINRVYMNDNPVVQKPGFRETIICLLPNLTMLDSDTISRNERDQCELKLVKYSPRIMNMVTSYMLRSIGHVDQTKWKQYLTLERQQHACKRLSVANWDKRSTYQYLCNKQLAERPKSSINELNKGFEQEITTTKYSPELFMELRQDELIRKIKLQKKHLEQQIKFQGRDHERVFVRNDQHHRVRAATCLQRHTRQFLARLNQYKHRAAIKIQAAWKGYHTRRRFEQEIVALIYNKFRAAEIIQAMIRGYKTRKAYQQAKNLDAELNFTLESGVDFDFEYQREFEVDVKIRNRRPVFDQVYRPPRASSVGTSQSHQEVRTSASTSGIFPPIHARQSWETPAIVEEKYDQVLIEEDDTSVRSSHNTSRISDDATPVKSKSNVQQQQQHKRKGISRVEIQKRAQEWGCSEQVAEDMIRYQMKMNKVKPKNDKTSGERMEAFRKKVKASGVPSAKTTHQSPRVFQQTSQPIRTPSNMSMRDDIEIQSVSSSSSSSSGGLSHRPSLPPHPQQRFNNLAQKDLPTLAVTRFPALSDSGNGISKKSIPKNRK